MSEQTNGQDQRIECPPTKDVWMRKFIWAGLLVALSLWCVLDRRKYPHPDQPLSFPTFDKYVGYWLNHYGPFLFVPLAGWFVYRGRKLQRHVLIADAQGIGYVDEPRLAWSDVKKLDTSVFDEKQILYLAHGEARRFKLDALALQRFKELVAFVETHVPDSTRDQKK